MPPHIPWELLEATFELTDTPESLSQIALSCLFRHTTISLGVGLQGGFAPGLVALPPLGPVLNRYQLFHDFLVESPHIAPHIRILNLGLPVLQSEVPIHKQSLESWPQIEACVAHILPMLHGLKSLGLFPCGPKTHTFHSHPHILDTIQSLSLFSLTLSKWCLSGSADLAGFGLKLAMSLTFFECEFDPPFMSLVADFKDLAMVRFDHCKGLVSFSKYWTPMQRARDMTITTQYLAHTAAEVRQALSAVAALVCRHLTIVIDEVILPYLICETSSSNSPAIFSLDSFSYLEALHIIFSDIYHDCPGFDTLNSISLEWFETAWAALVLPKRLSLSLTIKAGFTGSEPPDWELHLHASLLANPTFNIGYHTLQCDGSQGQSVQYVLVPNDSAASHLTGIHIKGVCIWPECRQPSGDCAQMSLLEVLRDGVGGACERISTGMGM
ncbi:hypothetical protein B0H17DRAFT_1141956 [Mycena rosella]|uniref:Uncharacterized protein n=1 Tax=Mycena rosella TaxID=1033263 RepID=A0AAD7GA07_MYCRO|nr:hypothetical protein B0H17DRAFT_1141956 [Mycena rosella]